MYAKKVRNEQVFMNRKYWVNIGKGEVMLSCYKRNNRSHLDTQTLLITLKMIFHVYKNYIKLVRIHLRKYLFRIFISRRADLPKWTQLDPNEIELCGALNKDNHR